MSIAKIENICISPAIAADLAGCSIDSPKPASEHDKYYIDVDGWVLGRECRVTAVEVIAERAVLQTMKVEKPRSDISRDFPDLPAAGNCGFRARVNLVGVPSDFELTLKAVFDDGRRRVLGTIAGNRHRLGMDDATTIQPLLLTTFGRSGSTWVMRLLGQHPDIVAYRPFEFESRAGMYWTEVFKALSDPKSCLQPIIHSFLDRHWWLGPDSVDVPRDVPEPELAACLGGTSVTSLAKFCHQQLDAFYHAAAPGARYFAEKFQVGPYSRRMLLEWYPRGKDVVLVRDPRDVFCSVESFNAKRGYVHFKREQITDDREYMKMLVNRIGALLHVPPERSNVAHILRYEDIMLDAERTLGKLLEYLELDAGAEVIARTLEQASTETSAMSKHRTVGNPADSVGRWRKDLPAHLRDLCQSEFGETMAQLGYS